MIVVSFYNLLFKDKNYKEITISLNELANEGNSNIRDKEYIRELISSLMNT